MKILFVADTKISDYSGWSGTNHSQFRELVRRGHQVKCLEDMIERTPFCDRALLSLHKRLGLLWMHNFSPWRSIRAAPIIRRAQTEFDPDVLFTTSPQLFASVSTRRRQIANLDVDPLTFARAFGAVLPSWSVAAVKSCYNRAMRNLEVMAYPTEFARQRHAEHFLVPNTLKLCVSAYGLNMELPSFQEKWIQDRWQSTPRKLLFVAVRWLSKGGPIAVEAVKILREKFGMNVELHIVGIDHVHEPLPDFCISYGFLNKSHRVDLSRLQNAYESAFAFILPTRFDAVGIVLAEAASYGLPLISVASGGTDFAVKQGKNGLLLPLHAGPEDFAEQIRGFFDDYELYRSLSLASRSLAEELTWTRFFDRLECGL